MTGPLVAITGASSGIGLALARAFAREGNALLLIARHRGPVEGLPADRTAYAEADVADYAVVERAIRGAEARFGKTACLVNNAGMADARGFHDVYPASYAHEIDVSLKGVFNCTKVVIGDISAARSGTIINISSISDRKVSPVAPAYIRTNIHAGMGISFDKYREILGNPDFMSAEELAEIVLYCWKLPTTICIRDIVVAPTRSTF